MDQCFYIRTENESTKFCHVNYNDILCKTCHTKLVKDTIPSRSYENSLKVDVCPTVLKDLNLLEKHFVCGSIKIKCKSRYKFLIG